MKRLPTGGPLNALNERFGCNSRARTVPVMALLDAHPTADAGVLRDTIERHAHSACACGIRSTGPVEKFALALYEAQFAPTAASWLAEHGRHRYEQCLRFHVALFCEAPIRGRKYEYASRELVERALAGDGAPSPWATRRATQTEDFDCAVDYVITHDGSSVLGVQVKPASAMYRRATVELNRTKQVQCDFPVRFHVYDDGGSFPAEQTREIVAAAIAAAAEVPPKRQRREGGGGDASAAPSSPKE